MWSLQGPLAGADEDRQVVALREVSRRRFGQTGLVVLGLRLQHFFGAVAVGCLLLGHSLPQVTSFPMLRPSNGELGIGSPR